MKNAVRMIERPNFYELSVPVFRNVFQDGQPLYKRLALVLVTLFFCGLSVFQVVERISYYLSEPTLISYEFQAQYMLRFPSISICPTRGFVGPNIQREMALRNVSEVYELLNTGLNLNDIWKLTGNNFTSHFKTCRYGGTKFCTGNWKEEYTLLGLCYTLEFPEPVAYSGTISSFLGAFTYDWPFQIKVFIHDITADITYAVYERGVQIPPRTGSFIYFNYRLVSYVNVSSSPCYSQDTYRSCIISCYDEEVLKNNTCRLPFITSVRSNLSLCSTSEEFEATYPFPYESFALSLFANVKQCKKGCGRPCVKYSYDVTADTRNTNFEDNTRLVISPLREGTHAFKERIAYRIDALFCDIGAILGLYLGISLLTVAEFLQILYLTFSFRNTYDS